MNKVWTGAIACGALVIGLAVPMGARGASDDRQQESSASTSDYQDQDFGTKFSRDSDSRSSFEREQESRSSKSRDQNSGYQDSHDLDSDYQGTQTQSSRDSDSRDETSRNPYSSDPSSRDASQSSGRQGSSSNWGARSFITRYDQDDDGYVSRTELPRDMRQEFSKLDRDGDGFLGRKELEQHAQMAQRRGATPVEVLYLWVIDANDGKMDFNQIQDAYSELRKIDKDNNGQITRNELSDRREQVVSRWCDQCFERLDKNDDGQLSQSEAADSTFGQKFSQFDRNDNGQITKSEIHRTVQDEFESQSASRSTPTSARR